MASASSIVRSLREPRHLRGAGLGAHDLVHGPARGLRRQVLPGQQRGEHGRPRHGARRQVSGHGLPQPRTSPRSGRLGDRTGQRDRVEGLRHRQVGLRPRGEPAVLRTAGEHEHGRALEDLVLELAAQPQPTHRRGLAVKDQEVERTALHRLDHGWCGGALTPAADLDVTRRTATHGHPDRVARGHVVAVEQDRDAVHDTVARGRRVASGGGRCRRRGGGSGHVPDATGVRSPTPAGPAGGRWGIAIRIGQ